MRAETRQQYRARRLCPACRRPNTEQGQRGDRLMHQVCRKWLDAGMTMAQVCDLVSDDLLLAALATGTYTTRALIAASGMSSATALRAAKRLRHAGRIERVRLRDGSAGRTYLYRQITEVAA